MSLLNIGMSGLNAAQGSLSVLSNNIANANTAGYSRQQIVQGSAASQQVGGVFIGTGTTLAGVIRAAEARGLRVPEDLSVVGFDGVRIDGFDRVLTTIRQPIVEMGRRAAQAVLAAQEGAPLPTLALDVELVVGDTTGPAPQRS